MIMCQKGFLRQVQSRREERGVWRIVREGEAIRGVSTWGKYSSKGHPPIPPEICFWGSFPHFLGEFLPQKKLPQKRLLFWGVRFEKIRYAGAGGGLPPPARARGRDLIDSEPLRVLRFEGSGPLERERLRARERRPEATQLISHLVQDVAVEAQGRLHQLELLAQARFHPMVMLVVDGDFHIPSSEPR